MRSNGILLFDWCLICKGFFFFFPWRIMLMLSPSVRYFDEGGLMCWQLALLSFRLSARAASSNADAWPWIVLHHGSCSLLNSSLYSMVYLFIYPICHFYWVKWWKWREKLKMMRICNIAPSCHIEAEQVSSARDKHRLCPVETTLGKWPANGPEWWMKQQPTLSHGISVFRKLDRRDCYPTWALCVKPDIKVN